MGPKGVRIFFPYCFPIIQRNKWDWFDPCWQFFIMMLFFGNLIFFFLRLEVGLLSIL